MDRCLMLVWVGQLSSGPVLDAGMDVWAGAPSLCLRYTSLAIWRGAMALPLAHICTAFHEKLSAAWASPRLVENPRDCASDGKQPGVKMCMYKHWMGGIALGAAVAPWLPHIEAGIPVAQHKRLMRFRLCCWPLAANRLCAAVPREQRVCSVCGKGVVEDERHVSLECPAYTGLRAAAEFGEGATMRRVVAPKGQEQREIMMEGDQVKRAEILSKIW